jgi:hypothetical protein
MGLKRRPPGNDVRRVRAIDGNLRGVITNKAGRLVQYESFAERSLLLRLDRDDNVLDYASQPETLVYTTPDGKSHRYTPDFIVWKSQHHTEIHEVTRSGRTTRPQQQARMTAARAFCQSRGWRYIVHTEHELPQGTELSNLLLLVAYRPLGYRHDLLQTWLAQQAPQTSLLGALAAAVEQANLPLTRNLYPSLYHAIWHGSIDINWEMLLLRNGQPNTAMPVSYGRTP